MSVYTCTLSLDTSWDKMFTCLSIHGTVISAYPSHQIQISLFGSHVPPSPLKWKDRLAHFLFSSFPCPSPLLLCFSYFGLQPASQRSSQTRPDVVWKLGCFAPLCKLQVAKETTIGRHYMIVGRDAPIKTCSDQVRVLTFECLLIQSTEYF